MSATGTALSADKHQQAVQHFRDGRLEEALHLLGEAIAEDETSERWNDWAAIQLAARNMTDAEKGLRRALQLQPENLQAAANLGAVLATLGKIEEAIPLLERGLPGLADNEKAIVSQLLHQ
jgi:Flp pilus assembly protein TadD